MQGLPHNSNMRTVLAQSCLSMMQEVTGGYKNAICVLPEDLIAAIQQHTGGEYLKLMHNFLNLTDFTCGGGESVEISVSEQQKTVEFWLTRAERDDAALRADLKVRCQRYYRSGYFVAVFFSGSKDLAQQTRDLVNDNCKRQAELEIRTAGLSKTVKRFPPAASNRSRLC